MECITFTLPTLAYLKTSLVVDTDKLSFTLTRTKTGLYEFDVLDGTQPWHFNRTLEDVITLLPTLGVPRRVILLDHDPEDPEDEEKVLL